jgi:predicted ATPase
MYTSLRLERFKSFKDAELKLGPFTVLIGANASGKSNIRDAFRFLHGVARGYSLAEIIGEKFGEGGERIWTGIRGGAGEIAFSGERSFALTSQSVAPAEFKPYPDECEYGGEILRYRIEVESRQKKFVPKVVAEALDLIDHMNVFSGHSANLYSQSVLLHADNIRCAMGPYILPRTVPFLGQVFKELRNSPLGSMISTNRGEIDIHWYDLFDQLCKDYDDALSIYRSSRFFDWSLDALRQPSIQGQELLSDDGRNLTSVLHAICADKQQKQNLLSWIQELTAMDVVDFEFQADPTGRILAKLVERNKQRTSLSSASDGTLRFLAFLAALLGPHRSAFCFFEELENGIHPTRLSLLLDLIENQVKNKNIQIVATTHSPQLLSQLSKESLEHAQLIYRLPDEPDARIIRVVDMPDARRLIKKYRMPDLFASGWFERTAHFMQADGDSTSAHPSAKPTRERAK